MISILFGLGVSGLIYNLQRSSRPILASRVVVAGVLSNNQTTDATVFLQALHRKLQSKGSQKVSLALFELPEILDLLTVCLRSGEGIYRSLGTVVPRARGELAKHLSNTLSAVNYGAALTDEIRKLPLALPHPQFAELANKIVLSLVRGTPLAKMLEDQAKSARAEIRNQLLRQAGKNEIRMLIPLVFLILPVIVLFAIYPSLKLLNFGFI